MTTTPLTSVQRVIRMLERRDHDRIPRMDGYWPETITYWQSQGLHGNDDTVLDLLRRDFLSIGGQIWPVAFPGREEILEEDDKTKLVKDAMGKIQRIWKNKSGTPEHVSFDCDSQSKWETIYKPAMLNAGTGINLDPIQATYPGPSHLKFARIPNSRVLIGIAPLRLVC